MPCGEKKTAQPMQASSLRRKLYFARGLPRYAAPS
jgi:hypothetical protein